MHKQNALFEPEFDQLTNLQRLDVDVTTVNFVPESDLDECIMDILPHLVNLRELILRSYPSFDCSVLSKLSYLNTFHWHVISDYEFEWQNCDDDLKQLTNLTELSTDVGCFSDKGLKKLTNLTSLSIESDTITQKSFQKINFSSVFIYLFYCLFISSWYKKVNET